MRMGAGRMALTPCGRDSSHCWMMAVREGLVGCEYLVRTGAVVLSLVVRTKGSDVDRESSPKTLEISGLLLGVEAIRDFVYSSVGMALG